MTNFIKELKIRFVHVISSVVIAAGFAYFFHYSAGMSREQRQDSKEVLIAVIGLMGTVVGFWVGSSNSSAKKDEVISSAMNNQPQVRAENIENLSTAAPGGNG